ncbi:DUF427 domain-containing protein [Phaeobacter sp. B1627]|uniref:DUF427 domain-containing protein n=1 Tax=Phaeobacter sp. B1627 TaxID=2583809 RepID=UPI001119F3C0|nr:DUF427 domain-containing protein [Phaeobacter sp. B1627]TNJ42669.1 DUF427 domain-containing protein [Phaeobacter sp. B1627]
MTKITIRKAEGTWVVRSGGAVLGESTKALELCEGDLAPVIYFPREDIAMAFLDKTEKTSQCPLKGDASYYSIANKSSVAENAAWSYETPLEGAKEIKGHLAFKVQESVKVEQV